MFLTFINRRLRDDAGFAMASVLGLMLVGVLLTTLILSTMVAAIGQTTSTRASVQSQASAEAGIAAARQGLIAGTCSANNAVYQSAPGATPQYKATIYVGLAGGGFTTTPTCPVTLATQVRIVSTGWAASPGVAGSKTGDKANLEAILSSAASPTSITATGPAVYASNSQGFGAGGILYSVDGSAPNVLIKTGDVTCNGAISGASDLVVDNGNLRVDNSCSITGNAWATGRITIPGNATVGGNAIANALTFDGSGKVLGNVWVNEDITMTGGSYIKGNATAKKITMSNGPKIDGTVVATDAVRLEGGGTTITGNVSAASLTFTSSGTVSGNAWIRGDTFFEWSSRVGGALTTKTTTQQNRGSVGGAVTINPAGPGTSPYLTNGTAPSRPVVPSWVDFGYNILQWTGFGNVTLTGSSCTSTEIKNAILLFGGQPGVINALGCTNGIKMDGGVGNVVAIPSDIAIFANKFDISGSAGFSSTKSVRLWLISPDSVSGDGATCPAGGSFSISGGSTFGNQIKMMIYTPCTVQLGSSTDFYGQVFAGKAGIDGAAKLHYVAVGLPGVDLNTGLTTPISATEANRTVTSVRSVSAGN